MKKVVGIFIFTLFLGSLSAQTMKVQVKEVKYKVGGYMNIAIYKSGDEFLKEKHAVYVKRDKAEGEIHTFLIPDLAYGEYAIAVYHDENSDGKLNSNYMGVPTEGYGFSNNPGFGKPSYSKSAVSFNTSNQQIVIDLRY